MSDQINLEPEHLHREGSWVLDAVGQSQQEHAGHHNTIADAASGFLGDAAGALKAWLADVQDQRTALHRGVEGLGTHLQESAGVFVATEDNNAQRVGKAL